MNADGSTICDAVDKHQTNLYQSHPIFFEARFLVGSIPVAVRPSCQYYEHFWIIIA